MTWLFGKSTNRPTCAEDSKDIDFSAYLDKCISDCGLNEESMIEYYPYFAESGKKIPVVADGSEKSLFQMLTENKSIQLIGARGVGRTTILHYLCRQLAENAKAKGADEINSKTVAIPVLLDIEQIHGLPASDSVAKQYCMLAGCDFSLKYRYYYLIDGSSHAYYNLPESVNTLVATGNGAMIITEADEFISGNPTKIILPLLSFGQICDYLLKRLQNTANESLMHFTPQERIAFFFKQLFNSLLSEYDVTDPLRTISSIYRGFKHPIAGDGYYHDELFYSEKLASSTELRKFPSTFQTGSEGSRREISIWKRVIKRNEVFTLLRYPAYLNLAIELFEKDPQQAIPCRASGFFYCLYRMQVANTGISATICEKFFSALFSTQEGMDDKKQVLVKKETVFSALPDVGNLAGITEELKRNNLIIQIDDAIAFRDQYVHDIYARKSVIGEEINARINALGTEKTPEAFIQLCTTQIENAEDDNNYPKDTIEIAADIWLDELQKEGYLLNDVYDRLIQIASSRITDTQWRSKASIMRAVSRLFGSAELVHAYQFSELLEVGSCAWVKLSDGRFISRYPIIFRDINEFVERRAYADGQFWSTNGWNSIVIQDETRSESQRRTAPIDIDEGGYPHFRIDNLPAVGITWFEAEAFCNWINSMVHGSFRISLPQKEIYEQCARAVAIDGLAINAENRTRIGRTSPVGMFDTSNETISDLLGNVWEWCENEFEQEQTMRYLFGGAWDKDIASLVPITAYPAHLSNNNIGFRLIASEDDDES